MFSLKKTDCTLRAVFFAHLELVWSSCCSLYYAVCNPTNDHSVGRMERLTGDLFMSHRCRWKVETECVELEREQRQGCCAIQGSRRNEGEIVGSSVARPSEILGEVIIEWRRVK